MGMANTNYRVTAIQVKVLFPFVIPYVRAFSLIDDDVVDRVDIESLHNSCILLNAQRKTLNAKPMNE